MLWQVIRTADTSDLTFNELTNFAKAMKKVPVSCKVGQEANLQESSTTLLWPHVQATLSFVNDTGLEMSVTCRAYM